MQQPIREDTTQLTKLRWRRLRWLLPLAGLLFFLSSPIVNVWLRMSVINIILILLSWRYIPLPWRRLWAWSGRETLVGFGFGLLLYVVGGLGFRLLVWLFPLLSPQAAFLYDWATQLPLWLALALLPLIVVGEEIFWRAAVGLPLVERFDRVSGTLLAGACFALAHVFVGPPLLWLAAFIFGTAWSAYLTAGRKLWPVFICHMVWDVLAIFLLPYSLW